MSIALQRSWKPLTHHLARCQHRSSPYLGLHIPRHLPHAYSRLRPSTNPFRSYQDLADASKAKSVTKPPEKQPVKLDEAPTTREAAVELSAHISPREQRRKDWNIIRKLLVHIWPKNDWGVRNRVLFGLALLLVGKVRRSHIRCQYFTRVHRF